MKGIVFTELLQVVDAMLGMNACERLIDAAQLPSGGAYTSVGTYPQAEMVALLTQLSAATATPVAVLLRDFGEHLFGRFAELYPHFLAGVGTTLESGPSYTVRFELTCPIRIPQPTS